MYRSIAPAGLLLLLAACSSTPPATVGASSIPTVTAAAPSALSTTRIDQLNRELAARSVYFSYDAFSIDSKFESVIRKNVELVKAVPGVSLVLEGNTDERGSSEYNLALGQKRADVIRKSLTLQGVSEAQIEAISLGKEKPMAACQDESCWSQNRRVDFVVKPVASRK